MNKILCIGEALIDLICTDKGRSLSAGENFIKKPGGAPTNVAAAIAALGGSVELAAKVGTDPFGKYLVTVLQSFGVGTKKVIEDEKYFTTFAFVSLMENGERDFYFNRGADGQLSISDIEDINLDDFSIVHFGSATAFLPGPLEGAYKALLLRALQKKIFISFDPNYRHLLFKNDKQSFIDQSWIFIKRCHFFKVSDEEAVLITGCTNLNDAAHMFLEKTNSGFAITLGKQGAILGLKGKISTVNSIGINPIDTTGAGDAFAGAILYQLSKYDFDNILQLNRNDWEKIIFNGNKAGARTCEYLGAMEAFKHLNKAVFD